MNDVGFRMAFIGGAPTLLIALPPSGYRVRPAQFILLGEQVKTRPSPIGHV